MIGVPVATALLLGYLMFSHVKGLDQQIADLKSANASMKPQVDAAVKSIARTESVDKFLDGDVNWLEEFRRLARTMPSSDQMIVRNISAISDARSGGGTLKILGSVTTPGVIDEFEESIRDETHRVVGDGASVQKNAKDAYRWDFTESITVTAESVRNGRYAAMNELLSEEKEATATQSTPEPETGPAEAGFAETGPAEAGPAETGPAETVKGEEETPVAESPPPDDSPPDDSPPDDSTPDKPVAASDEGASDEGVSDEQATEEGESTQPATESVEPAPAELAAQAEVQS
jgi:hypothetical protein